jgi:4-alpha-glucanotransferase
MNRDEQQINELYRLAAAHGIQRSYFDIWGNVHETTLETLEEMLLALGVDVSRPAEALLKLDHTSWTQLAQPVLVESIEQLPGELFFQIPTHRVVIDHLNSQPRVQLEIIGENTAPSYHAYNSEQLAFKEARQIDGTIYERWGVPFPAGLSTGYYHFNLTVEAENQKHQQPIKVIFCPAQTYLPPGLQGDGRVAGIAISLFGLRSRRNWGVGDFGDLKEFTRWAIGSLHVDVIGLNPLHAISNRQPYNISPYFPSSRFFKNSIYLDIEAMADYRSCPEAREFVQAAETQTLLAELRQAESVQYERVAKLKLKVLKMVFRTFLQTHWSGKAAVTKRGRELQTYVDKEGSLLDNFASFCALQAFLNKEDSSVWAWWQWPQPFQHPDSHEVQAFRRTHWEEILFHKYLQWHLEAQLQEVQSLAYDMGACVGLYHDLALGSDPGGADCWAFRDFFVDGMTVGAPPDDFALDGQDWGFQPPHREMHRQSGYDLFITEIRKNCQPGGALRIDHIMRFFRLFWIIARQPAKNGTYVENYYQDLFKILALESDGAKTLIIGEDLGTVPPQVREALEQYRIFSYRLFYFERDHQGDLKEPESYPVFALASVSTHDLPTLQGFWTAEDISLRHRLEMFPSEDLFHAALEQRKKEKKEILKRLVTSDFLAKKVLEYPDILAELTDELHSAIIGFLLSTPAKLVIISQEDLFKDGRQQNLPGTVLEYPNWSTKMKYTLEELRQERKVEKYTRVYRAWIDRTGRGVPA